jgi:hypothetical protein
VRIFKGSRKYNLSCPELPLPPTKHELRNAVKIFHDFHLYADGVYLIPGQRKVIFGPCNLIFTFEQKVSNALSR